MFKSRFVKFFSIGLLSLVVISPSVAHADAVAGDMIITLGEDLTLAQRDVVFEHMGVLGNETEIVYVSNAEEHKYLGDYIPANKIGNKALSSALITTGEKGSGLVVETNNINYITEDMYRNSLSTAGITDAKVFVTAPFTVSGTGALTGVMKAYEQSMGVKISDNQKKIANEEMVATADLSETTGAEEATAFVSTVKETIAEENATTKEDIKAIIQRVAAEMGITLTDEQIQGFVDLFYKIKDLNIDWTKVNDSLTAAKEKWDAFVTSEETKNIAESFMQFLKDVWNWILSIFQKEEAPADSAV